MYEIKSKILVVGDIILDRYWFGDVSRISPEAPVPVVLVKQVEDRLGGAANVANNIAALGSPVSLMGVVGNDATGNDIAALAQEKRITTYFCQDDTLQTTVKLRVLGLNQQLLRIDFEEKPNLDIIHAQFVGFCSVLPSVEIVILSDYHKGALTNVSSMIAEAKRQGKTVLVDPKGSDYRRYAGATVITPNRSELAQVVGHWHDEEDLARRVQALRGELNFEALLLTRSEEGMTLFTDNDILHVAAQAREVYDVSGAGDTVIATLAVMLSYNKPLKEAVTIANRAAGIVVSKIGTAVVSKEELF